MDLNNPIRFHNRKKPTSSTERFLRVPTHAPPLENPNSSNTDELNEDDVVFFSDDSTTEPNHHSSTPSSSSSSSTPIHHHHNHRGFGFCPSDAFGILAALPENDSSPNARNGNHFFHKASSVSLSSSSSSSSSCLIPVVPKPTPHERISLPSSVKYHQSAPVNVPIMSPAMMSAVRRRHEFDDDVDEEELDDEAMLPPHEMVARDSARSPVLSCSVLEGVGRTLKGRDLRQVRNAIWRQTGFLD